MEDRSINQVGLEIPVKDLAQTLTVQELRDLTDLLGSPGWRLLSMHVDREWGAIGFGEKVAHTIGSIGAENQALAVQQLREATVTQREVQRIMAWPQKAINDGKRALIEQHQATGMGRGGV